MKGAILGMHVAGKSALSVLPHVRVEEELEGRIGGFDRGEQGLLQCTEPAGRPSKGYRPHKHWRLEGNRPRARVEAQGGKAGRQKIHDHLRCGDT